MQETWLENGPPMYISLAAYVGWKPPASSGKRKQEEYGNLAELEAMFSGSGGVIRHDG